MLTPKFDELVQQLKVLPGVGAKTAQRMALHLLTYKRLQGQQLAEALMVAMTQIKQCQICRGLSDEDICPVCSDPRRSDAVLCIVETAADMMAIEQTANFDGQYFVLGGHLSPIDGIGAAQLGIHQLIERLKQRQQQGGLHGHRISFLYHPRRRDSPRTPLGKGGSALQEPQPAFYRHLL